MEATVELPGADLLARLPGLVTSHAREVPGAAEAAYPAESIPAKSIPAVRALLGGCRRRARPAPSTCSPKSTARAPAAPPVTGAYPTPPPLAELMADPLSGPDGGYPAGVFDPACGGGRLLVAAARRVGPRARGFRVERSW
jgi:hypothetical protein